MERHASSTPPPASSHFRPHSDLFCELTDPDEASGRGIDLLGLDPGEIAHAAGDPFVATVGEEEVGLAEGAEVRRLDLLDPGAGEQAAGDLGEVEHAAVGD